ncbi:helix-turn-helix domain-containing protein [Morganella morganii]|uniref:Helix-turn-helix domain-containing protein n=1 Tax=Morganella morganii TaxID=582 RepID=A0AAE4FDF3_MORMO|nr:helix-turn-helix transcriptional regulator [Morganella morganii]MCT1588457.1 helix-turn-helix domain-containing protein [Morganella morganii]MDS0898985.1 helix-turn-helix domain-containing protein [Morganella morganii]
MSLGDRIKEERKRLGLTQVKFAECVGVQPTTQINYEKNTRIPDAVYLEKADGINCDVLYLVTGQKSQQLDISAEEQVLLDNYRSMSPAARLNVLAVAAAFAKSESPEKREQGC